jgi:Domain of unknown function (DUF4124)
MKIKNQKSTHVLGLILALGVLPSTAALAQINKCKEDNGKIVYSDAPCRPPPPPKVVAIPSPAPVAKVASPAPVAAPPAPVFNAAKGGKLNEASVAALLQHASDLSVQSNYRAQCALVASDIKFNLTDNSTRPATVLTGGRKELCDAQRDSALAFQAAQLQSVEVLGKQSINVNSAGTQAVASYESTTTLSMQGQVVMRMRCSRKETLSVYQEQILYSDLLATCKPQ